MREAYHAGIFPDDLTAMFDPGEPYRPGNHTEFEFFYAAICADCVHDSEAAPCPLIARMMAFNIGDPDYPAELVHRADGQPTCTARRTTPAPPPRCDQTLELDL